MEAAHILDHYVIGRMVIVSTALELVAFAWIYGKLSVWMPTGIRYVVTVVWSSVLMAFLILEQILLLLH